MSGVLAGAEGQEERGVIEMVDTDVVMPAMARRAERRVSLHRSSVVDLVGVVLLLRLLRVAGHAKLELWPLW